MKIFNRIISLLLASRRARKLFRRSTLVAGALGLAIAVNACTTTPTVDQSSTDSSPVAQTQPAADTAQSAPATKTATKTYAENGVAISGADPVAYFTEATYVPGSADYTYDWQGTTWQFSSEENRDLFAANPEQYAPEYGGFCAWAVAAKDTLVPTDPNAWSVVDNKLYLNANQRVQATWE
ncbi:MAG: YHS domain-containing (seleno)protein, partial [Cyanobacteria bacterium P01_D01_bin.1]